MAFAMDRRALLAAMGCSFVGPVAGQAASSRKTLMLELVASELPVRSGQPPSKVWRFAGDVPRLVQGEPVDVTIANRLPVPVAPWWHGLDGHPDLEPLLSREPIAPSRSATYSLTPRNAGTLLMDARILPAAGPLPVLPIVVEPQRSQTDADEVLLIEDWRLGPDGSALAPGADPGGTDPVYTLNGKPRVELNQNAGRPLRLRVINGAQRIVLALQFTNADVRVIAIDGQPSEPFPARDGRLVMAPGTRIDAQVTVSGVGEIALNDGTRTVKLGEIKDGSRSAPAPADISPLPSNGLPEKLTLQTALRVTVDLDGGAGWIAPQAMSSRNPPTFRVTRGRTVVMALKNPSQTAAVFHLHGHHMRLLDRLDDGWKPFWLDTVAVPGQQTVRVAFSASYPGAYLMAMAQADWRGGAGYRNYLVDG